MAVAHHGLEHGPEGEEVGGFEAVPRIENGPIVSSIADHRVEFVTDGLVVSQDEIEALSF